MSKTIIIPDIHNKCRKAEQIIEAHGWEKSDEVERIVFLGDYFDSFGDNKTATANTAQWLKESLKKTKRLHLVGNHDLPYVYPWNSHMDCPGWCEEKNKVVRDILSKEELESLETHFLMNANPRKGRPRPILVTHAGLTLPALYGFHPTLGENRMSFLNDLPPEEHLKRAVNEFKRWRDRARNNTWHSFMELGSRAGMDTHGGPFWLDWADMTGLEGIDQIVGHTNFRSPKQLIGSTSTERYWEAWCIDTYLNFHAEINESGITII